MASPPRIAPAIDTTTTSQEEKDQESTMTYDYNQENFWDGATFYQQSLATTPLDGGFFESTPLGMTINTSSPQYSHGLISEPAGISYSEWGGSIQGDLLSGGDFSPSAASPNSRTFSEPSTRSRPGPRRPSAEAIARRRKQNRVSQAAWRARNKELVEELRQEIAEYSEYNQSMQETMHSLLKTTESLRGVIENALARPLPGGQDAKRNNGEGQLLSPQSSGGDLDAPHDPQ
ncbi:uncharacterized protein PAC_01180 [Phialocephala subalpina]|uniref:BZIP domain-containing protein n=1 Tax=Phialocephala subalpina TaxID=576137 RepID=A0A1L7WEW3_9HELO|nr:uncharacterized protein PAC_01180 [Phialocephala subalpina]